MNINDRNNIEKDETPKVSVTTSTENPDSVQVDLSEEPDDRDFKSKEDATLKRTLDGYLLDEHTINKKGE